ncbi:hypothetical protein D3C75_898300 [compost metagenome]
MFAVGHAPGVQVHAAAADTAQGKHTAVAQRLVDFFEQAGQVGLLFNIVGVLSNEVGHGRASCVGGVELQATSATLGVIGL